jgi:hypothetical protein
VNKFFVCIGIFLYSLIGYAQVANNTSLVGTVTDPSSNVVVGAKVTGVNVDTKVEYTGITNKEGYYSIPFVNPGTYSVTVEQPGFSKAITKGIVVTINLAVRTDVTLQVGSTNSEINVSADNPPLSTDDALLGETIEAQRVHDLPLNGRNAINLAATTSNITIAGNTLTGNPPGNTASGSGTRGVNNSISLDGISILNNLITTATLSPNPDALDSVQTQNGNYTAQYGDYIGVHINMVTKTGGNKLHGTVYDYVQNDMFNSYSFGATPGQRKSQVRYNLFGGVVSGPVIIPFLYNGHDKTFFTGSYEGLRQSNASLSTGTVLSNLMRNSNFSELCPAGFNASGICTSTTSPNKQIINPTTRAPYANNIITDPINAISTTVLSYIPLPTKSGVTNNYVNNLPNVVDTDNTLDRVDHNIGDKVRLFARYAWTKTFNLSGAIVPSSNSYTPTTNRNGAFGYTHIITPNIVNDLRAGFNVLQTDSLNYFYYNNIQGAGSALGIPGFTADVVNNNPGLPTVNITSYQGVGSDGTNWFQDDRTLTIYDQISYTHNKHSLMAGVSFRKLTLGRASTSGARGTFTFNGQYSGDAAADFLFGDAQRVATPYFQVKVAVGQLRDGFFVQDTWQVSQKFTLQYGLRYELPEVAYSLNGVGRKLTPDQLALYPAQGGTNAANAVSYPGYKYADPNHDNVAPRLGFSYRFTNKTVLRGGGGIYYNANQMNAYTLTNQNYPYSSSTVFTGKSAGSGTPDVTFQTPTPGAGSTSPVGGALGTYVTAITENQHLPSERMYQWNVDVGQEMWRNAGFELQYIGSRSLHLNESWYSNQPDAPGANAPTTRYSTSTSVINANRPNQFWGQIRTIQNDGFSTYNGLTAILRQRMSHGLTMTASYTWSHNLDTSDDSNSAGSAMWQGHLKLDYGNSNSDIRNRFVATATYALPTFSGHNLLVQEALGGWQVNGIFDIRSGTPFNVTSSGDRVYVGAPGSGQRPNYVHAGKNTCNKAFLLAYGSSRSCIDATAYALPAQGVYGNLHRNDQHGPAQLAQNSASLFKNFKIWEDVSFQFRAEAFNFLNHANISSTSLNTTLSNNTLSNPNDPTSFIVPAAFGTMTGSGQRTFQLAGKINF